MGGAASQFGRWIDPTNPNGVRQYTPIGAAANQKPNGGKGGEAPSVPDFTGAAQQQQEQSRQNVNEQTQANRPNQNTPFSSSQWSQDANGNWTQNVSLTPGLNDAAQSISNQIGQGSSLDPGQARDQAINAAYGQATSRLDPQWAQRSQALDAQLANQGLTPGSRAYDASRQNSDMARNDAYAQAMYGAQTGAGNTAFQQSLNANMQPYQQLGALQGLTQQPSFSSAGQAQTPNLLGALGQQYAGELQQYGIDQASKNSKMSGGAGLGAAAIGASDERLKTNVERLKWEAIPGVPFATWEWKHRPGERQWGVIAQDLERVRPDLVVMQDGIRFVDYGKLWEARHA